MNGIDVICPRCKQPMKPEAEAEYWREKYFEDRRQRAEFRHDLLRWLVYAPCALAGTALLAYLWQVAR